MKLSSAPPPVIWLTVQSPSLSSARVRPKINFFFGQSISPEYSALTPSISSAVSLSIEEIDGAIIDSEFSSCSSPIA